MGHTQICDVLQVIEIAIDYRELVYVDPIDAVEMNILGIDGWTQNWRKYEKDVSFTSPVTIGALCSIYHVNKEWLDTNEGEMYIDVYKPGDSLGELISLEEVLLRELKGIVFD